MIWILITQRYLENKLYGGFTTITWFVTRLFWIHSYGITALCSVARSKYLNLAFLVNSHAQCTTLRLHREEFVLSWKDNVKGSTTSPAATLHSSLISISIVTLRGQCHPLPTTNISL